MRNYIVFFSLFSCVAFAQTKLDEIKQVERQIVVPLQKGYDVDAIVLEKIAEYEKNRFVLHVSSQASIAERPTVNGINRGASQVEYKKYLPQVHMDSLSYSITSCNKEQADIHNAICVSYTAQVSLYFESGLFLSPTEMIEFEKRIKRASEAMLNVKVEP